VKIVGVEPDYTVFEVECRIAAVHDLEEDSRHREWVELSVQRVSPCVSAASLLPVNLGIICSLSSACVCRKI
jgi:hypothetical protein